MKKSFVEQILENEVMFMSRGTIGFMLLGDEDERPNFSLSLIREDEKSVGQFDIYVYDAVNDGKIKQHLILPLSDLSLRFSKFLELYCSEEEINKKYKEVNELIQLKITERNKFLFEDYASNVLFSIEDDITSTAKRFVLKSFEFILTFFAYNYYTSGKKFFKFEFEPNAELESIFKEICLNGDNKMIEFFTKHKFEYL